MSEFRHTAEGLKQFQSLKLKAKITLSKARIKAWYEYWDGEVYVAFSGGKDSTVLLHLVRQMYPEVPAVFTDTGLEFPEIREFVKTVDNVEWLKPKMPFKGCTRKVRLSGRQQANRPLHIRCSPRPPNFQYTPATAARYPQGWNILTDVPHFQKVETPHWGTI